MKPKYPRVFLSYSSDDHVEVQALATELRRRGVPLWWDRTDLPRGRTTETSLREAADAAAGFAFYLTESAARSHWVREKERHYALANQAKDESFGIFPVFRDDLRAVTKVMQDEGEGGDPTAYDLTGFHGYAMERDAATGTPRAGQIAAAAGDVLRQLLQTLAERSPDGSTLRIGARTRDIGALRKHDLDLLVDWKGDYPDRDGRGDHPNPTTARELQAALASLREAIGHEWPGTRIRIVPQCHLTMALAVGFLFRRNSGIELEVVNSYTGEIWDGPHQPMAALDAWWADPGGEEKTYGRGDGLAVSIGISRPIHEQVDELIDGRGLAVEKRLDFQPASGPDTGSMTSLTGPEAHQAAQTVVRAIAEERAAGLHGPVHLIAAGPPGFAVLLAQHLSNLGAIQTYEWKDGDRAYVPVFMLQSS